MEDEISRNILDSGLNFFFIISILEIWLKRLKQLHF